MRRYYGLVIALMCCMVIFPSETVAQRAAVGMGSKLKKGLFGGNSFGIKQNSAQEGEDNDEDGDNGMMLQVLMIVTEKPGITLTMLVGLVGYVYLYLFQQKKINNIEQTLASGGGNGGEWPADFLLAYLSCSFV
jgi:hypothetical protein